MPSWIGETSKNNQSWVRIVSPTDLFDLNSFLEQPACNADTLYRIGACVV